MTKLSDIPKDFYLEFYKQLPQLDEKAVRFLWHNHYYDMPLDGILIYQGKIHWFQIFRALRMDEGRSRVDENGIVWNDYSFRYLVVELSEEQIREEKYWHELFRQKVGTHTDYDDGGRRKAGELKPRGVWNEFYEPYKMRTTSDFSNNLVIGWFEKLATSYKLDEDDDEDD